MVVSVTGVGMIVVKLVMICTKFAMISAMLSAAVKTVVVGSLVRASTIPMFAAVLGMVAGMTDCCVVDCVVSEGRGDRNPEREDGGGQKYLSRGHRVFLQFASAGNPTGRFRKPR